MADVMGKESEKQGLVALSNSEALTGRKFFIYNDLHQRMKQSLLSYWSFAFNLSAIANIAIEHYLDLVDIVDRDEKDRDTQIAEAVCKAISTIENNKREF